MKEEIVLFGRKITLPENGGVIAGGEYTGESCVESSNGSVGYDRCLEVSKRKGDVQVKQKQADEDQEEGEIYETTQQNDDQIPTEESDNTNHPSSESSDNNPKTPSINDDIETENEKNAQEKSLKKPDNILPCPRCDSMDTKFCYYNNYNVNQPRHFCKNCQRYWTDGGIMRNVPVGAGRRKNKKMASHFPHMITISNVANGFNHVIFKPNDGVLSFGPVPPLCASVASGLNLAEKRVPDCAKNGENSENGFQSAFVSWPPYPAIYPPGYHPPPYYYSAAPVWNYNVPNPNNAQWLPAQSPNANQKATITSSPGSPLGKHSRNGELLNSLWGKESKYSENSIVVPETLRIDDPEEAAKSSIWSTLGIKYDSYSREGLRKGFRPKGDEKKSNVTTSPLLEANPAAMSRSITFRESV